MSLFMLKSIHPEDHIFYITCGGGEKLTVDLENSDLGTLLKSLNGRYTFVPDAFLGREEEGIILKTKLTEVAAKLGCYGTTPLGFAFFYQREEKAFMVKPSSISKVDWQWVLAFLSDFAFTFNCTILEVESGKEYTYSSILKFNYEPELLFNYEFIRRIFQEDRSINILSLSDSFLSVSRQDFELLALVEDPLARFEELVKERMLHPGERVRARYDVFDGDDGAELFTSYEVPWRQDFILKEEPVLQGNIRGPLEKFRNSFLYFIDFNEGSREERLPLVDFYFALNHFPPEKMERFGCNDVFIQALTVEEVATIEKLYQEKNDWEIRQNEACMAAGKEMFFDIYEWHYSKIRDKQLEGLTMMSACKHMADYLRFCIEEDLMSDFFKKYFGFVCEDVLNKTGRIDLNAFLVNSLDGRLSRYLFNRKGEAFAEFYYHFDGDKQMDETYVYTHDVDACAEDFFGSETYHSPQFQNEAYLFVPFDEEYYQYFKKHYLEKAYAFFCTEKFEPQEA